MQGFKAFSIEGLNISDERFAEYFKTLRPLEKRVLSLRLGLEDGIRRTLDEVAKELDVTSARVLQIETKALCRPRRYTRVKRLKDFLDD